MMNMLCANKNCKAELKYLRGGRLFLMERQPNQARKKVTEISRSKHTVTMRRYFWLCETCSEAYSIHRWSDEGIELAPRQKAKRISTMSASVSRMWTTPGLVG